LDGTNLSEFLPCLFLLHAAMNNEKVKQFTWPLQVTIHFRCHNWKTISLLHNNKCHGPAKITTNEQFSRTVLYHKYFQ